MPDTGYASVNGLQMYYEIHGSGRPLVLIHGAFGSITTDFAAVLPRLEKTRQAIAVELQGHGHTADIDRPFGYDAWADDIAALLDELGIDTADLFGYSVGGTVAMHTARRHPQRVGKIVVAGGTSFKLDGLYSEVLAGLGELQPEMMAGTPWAEAYAAVAPNPDDWPRLIAKKNDLDRSSKDWTAEEVAAITAPMLLMIGDSDIVRPEHVVEMFRLIGGGVLGDLVGLPRSQLAVLPGTTHVTLVHRGEWVASMTEQFLDAPLRGQ